MDQESEAEDETVYMVVVNDEEQYSIWPVDRELPAGWRGTGKEGSRSDCLNHIEEIWIDMRPLSVRQRILGERPPRPGEEA